MYDASKIVAGLAVFVVLATSPLWYNAASGSSVAPPELKLPTDSTQCVEATDYMRASHMDLLNEWRDQVVRENDRYEVGSDGVVERIDLDTGRRRQRRRGGALGSPRVDVRNRRAKVRLADHQIGRVAVAELHGVLPNQHAVV